MIAVKVVWMTALWVVLWGDLSAANVIGGLAVSAVVLTALPLRTRDARFTVRPLPALALLGWFLIQLVRSSAVVVMTILVPRDRVNTGIVAIPVRAGSDGIVTLIGNFITLTPGTLTLEVRRDPPTLYVHVLHVDDVESVRREVQRLERMAVRAFGSREALAALDAADAAVSTGAAHGPGVGRP